MDALRADRSKIGGLFKKSKSRSASSSRRGSLTESPPTKILPTAVHHRSPEKERDGEGDSRRGSKAQYPSNRKTIAVDTENDWFRDCWIQNEKITRSESDVKSMASKLSESIDLTRALSPHVQHPKYGAPSAARVSESSSDSSDGDLPPPAKGKGKSAPPPPSAAAPSKGSK